MNSSSLSSLSIQLKSIHRGDRWQAYERLQSLDISCCCSADGWIEVEINTPTDIAQLGSVFRQLTASRSELIGWLEYCWRVAL